VAPPSVCHAFSFTIPSSAEAEAGNTGGALANAWDLAVSSSARPSVRGKDEHVDSMFPLIFSTDVRK
jgi:hypothetical protein